MSSNTKNLLEGPQPTQTLPAWWRDAQDSAWKQFQSLPYPSRTDEDWRFATISAVHLDQYNQSDEATSARRDSVISRSETSFKNAAQAVFANDHLLDIKPLSKELAAKGVIWEPIESAIKNHGDLLQKYFMKNPVVLGSPKFAALHRAYCKAGMLVYVPRGVEIAEPLAAFHWLDTDSASIFPHTLIITEDNAKVTVIDYLKSDEEIGGFSCAVNDLYVGKGANVRYVAHQNLSEKIISLQINSTEVEKDGYAKTLMVNLGGRYSRVESKSALVGEGAKSEMLSLSVADGKQEFDQRTLQQHVAPHTWSDLLYKNTLNYQSKSIFRGLIRVEPHAAQTDAYQTNRNLLLSGDCEADSMPGLEILNDDVKCSHGATTGQIDETQLFYMQQRGIQPDVAKKLLSFGFFDEVLQRFGDENIAKGLRADVENKFLHSKASQEASEIEQPDSEGTDVRQLQGTK